MALSRFVVTATVTVGAGTPTGDATGGASVPGTAWAELWGVTFRRADVIVADSSAGTTSSQLLYAAVGSTNLRPAVAGTDDVGHAALGN
jgi:hypothetical protein